MANYLTFIQFWLFSNHILMINSLVSFMFFLQLTGHFCLESICV